MSGLGPSHGGRHPLEPRRDRSVEATHRKAPPVPRAPRAKPKANSAGALARDMWRPSSATRSSEERRPREDSPFSFARVSKLTRERESVENQRIEVGPPKLPDKTDHKRSHSLGQAIQANQGIPWSDLPPTGLQAGKDPARRNTLKHEFLAADQDLEWVPKVECKAPGGRMDALAREQRADEESREWSLGVRGPDHAPTAGCDNPGYHGRRNVICREMQEHTTDMPRASGCVPDSGVPAYGRKSVLAREKGLNGAPQVSCH